MNNLSDPLPLSIFETASDTYNRTLNLHSEEDIPRQSTSAKDRDIVFNTVAAPRGYSPNTRLVSPALKRQATRIRTILSITVNFSL